MKNDPTPVQSSGAEGLSWILVGIILLFGVLLVNSYHDNVEPAVTAPPAQASAPRA